jgi:hypothetical protein
VTGVAFALLSYFIYYAAIVILGATAGYALGAGLLASFGMDGFLSVIVGIIAGVALAIAVLILAVPAVLVVVVSAFSGAAAVVNGALILLGQVKLDDVDAGLMEGLLKYGVVAVVAGSSSPRASGTSGATSDATSIASPSNSRRIATS